MTTNIYSICTKWVCHSYCQLLIIKSFNILLSVNIQINLTLNLNEYFIAIGINIQCLHMRMALGHIYTNGSSIEERW